MDSNLENGGFYFIKMAVKRNSPSIITKLLDKEIVAKSMYQLMLMYLDFLDLPQATKIKPFQKAVNSGYSNIVELLLPWVDHKAFLWALEQGLDDDLKDLLLQHADSFFLQAIQQQDWICVEYLLTNARSSCQSIQYCLQQACSTGAEATAKLILDLDDVEMDPSTALCAACSNGHVAVVEALLQDERFDATANQNAPIRLASASGHKQIVLLLYKTDNRVDVTVENNATLRFAVSKGDTEVVELLLNDNRVDPTPQANALFLAACKKGFTQILQLLLQDTRITSAVDDITGFNCACEHSQNEVAELLLQHNPTLNVNSTKALEYACNNCNINLLMLLILDQRADTSWENSKAFRLACAHNAIHICRLLLEDERIDPSAADDQAFRKACQFGNVELVDLLLQDNRINPAAKNNFGIRKAAANGHIEVVQKLLSDNRVDPSAKRNYALRKASCNGYSRIVQLLLYRVQPNSQDLCYAVKHAARHLRFSVLRVFLRAEHHEVSPPTIALASNILVGSDILKHIFSFCSPHTLLRTRRVCKDWKEIVSENCMWLKFWCRALSDFAQYGLFAKNMKDTAMILFFINQNYNRQTDKFTRRPKFPAQVEWIWQLFAFSLDWGSFHKDKAVKNVIGSPENLECATVDRDSEDELCICSPDARPMDDSDVEDQHGEYETSDNEEKEDEIEEDEEEVCLLYERTPTIKWKESTGTDEAAEDDSVELQNKMNEEDINDEEEKVEEDNKNAYSSDYTGEGINLKTTKSAITQGHKKRRFNTSSNSQSEVAKKRRTFFIDDEAEEDNSVELHY